KGRVVRLGSEPECLPQVLPMRVVGLDKRQLLDPHPAFDALLALDSGCRTLHSLEVNESSDSVAPGTPELRVILVLPEPPSKIIRHAHIQSVRAARQDINEHLVVTHDPADPSLRSG